MSPARSVASVTVALMPAHSLSTRFGDPSEPHPIALVTHMKRRTISAEMGLQLRWAVAR